MCRRLTGLMQMPACLMMAGYGVGFKEKVQLFRDRFAGRVLAGGRRRDPKTGQYR